MQRLLNDINKINDTYLKSTLTLYSIPSLILTGFFLKLSFDSFDWVGANSFKSKAIGSGLVEDIKESVNNSI